MAESSATRLQMLINRAQRLNTEATRPQIVENQDDDDFLSGQGFNTLEGVVIQEQGHLGKRKKPMYSIKVTCLNSPQYQTINPTIVKAMNGKQLGYRPIKIERSAIINKLTEKVMSIFKFSCPFKYMKAVRNTINICELKELQVTSAKDVKSKIGRSNLYILPAEKDAIPQRRSRNNDLTDEDMIPPITAPVRQRLDLSIVSGAGNAVNNQDPPLVSRNNSARSTLRLTTSRRRTLSTPRRPRSTAIRNGTQEQENNADLNPSSIIDVTEETPPVSRNNSARSTLRLTTSRRRTLSTPRRPRSTAIRNGTQEQENNADLNPSSIIDVTEETPPEVVAAEYCTATGDSPTVLFRTSAPQMVDQINTHAISNPNQTNRSQQIIDITRGLHVNENNGLNEFIPDTAPFGDVGQNLSADGLKDVLVEHRELFIRPASEKDPLLMEVRRGYVLVDSIAIIRFSGEDLHSPLSIKFIDEEGVGLGGLRR